MARKFARLESLGCSFAVAGRLSDGAFLGLEDMQVKAAAPCYHVLSFSDAPRHICMSQSLVSMGAPLVQKHRCVKMQKLLLLLMPFAYRCFPAMNGVFPRDDLSSVLPNVTGSRVPADFVLLVYPGEQAQG